jgi:hypothetical protein
MTPRELVERTLAFDRPARVPRQTWLLPWAVTHHPERVAEIQRAFPDDIVSAPPCLTTPPRGEGDRYALGESTDEWGCVFVNLQAGIIGEVKEPLLTDWDRIDRVRIPIERLTVDRTVVNDFCRQSDRYVLAGTCPRPFERLQFLRGSENCYLDLMDRPPELSALLEQIHDFYIKELELWATTEVDALYFMDDWGAQKAMLISPVLWREMFMPMYRDYIEIAHRSGKAAFMHSDGYITNILPDLIELGLDAINCQVFCMDVKTLGERCGGKITFWGELDRQYILPRGTRAEVKAAVTQLKAAFYRDGGFIAQCEFGAGTNPDNVQAYFTAWQEV